VILPDTEFNQKDLTAEIKQGVTCLYTFCALGTQVLSEASELLLYKITLRGGCTGCSKAQY